MYICIYIYTYIGLMDKTSRLTNTITVSVEPGCYNECVTSIYGYHSPG